MIPSGAARPSSPVRAAALLLSLLAALIASFTRQLLALVAPRLPASRVDARPECDAARAAHRKRRGILRGQCRSLATHHLPEEARKRNCYDQAPDGRLLRLPGTPGVAELRHNPARRLTGRGRASLVRDEGRWQRSSTSSTIRKAVALIARAAKLLAGAARGAQLLPGRVRHRLRRRPAAQPRGAEDKMIATPSSPEAHQKKDYSRLHRRRREHLAGRRSKSLSGLYRQGAGDLTRLGREVWVPRRLTTLAAEGARTPATPVLMAYDQR